MKIFIEWLIVSVMLSVALYLLASFGALSFVWFLNVEAITRFLYGFFQILILMGSFVFVIDMNERKD